MSCRPISGLGRGPACGLEPTTIQWRPIQRRRHVRAYTLSSFHLDLVRIECQKCGRFGQYRRAKLVARYGPDGSMPDLLSDIAADCPKTGDLGLDRCGALFPDLGAVSRVR